jgi:hypothetical protein
MGMRPSSKRLKPSWITGRTRSGANVEIFGSTRLVKGKSQYDHIPIWNTSNAPKLVVEGNSNFFLPIFCNL